jgi:hypothetical protein
MAPELAHADCGRGQGVRRRHDYQDGVPPLRARPPFARNRRLDAAALGARLDAVTVYKGDEIYFDRQKFSDRCGLPRNRVHAVEGAAHKGIAEVANAIGADVLVIGCANRNLKEGGSIIGDTAQRIIDAVDTDLVVIRAA